MTLMAGRERATIALLLGMALSGTTGLFSMLSGQPVINVVFCRCLFGALTLAAWAGVRGRSGPVAGIDRRTGLMVVASGLCLVFNWLALFQAFHLTSIGFATIVYHLQPFWIVMFGGWVLKEGLPVRKVGWLTLAFLGLALAVLPQSTGLQGGPGWRTGTAFALAASVLYAATTLTTRAVKGMRPEIIGTIHCLIGCAVFLPGLDLGALDGAGVRAWSSLAIIGVVHTGLVYVLLYSAYPKVTATTIAAASFLNPAAALLSDLLVFGRSITMTQTVGLGFILLAGCGVTLGWPSTITKGPGSD